jgi:hypothetical protein
MAVAADGSGTAVVAPLAHAVQEQDHRQRRFGVHVGDVHHVPSPHAAERAHSISDAISIIHLSVSEPTGRWMRRWHLALGIRHS